MSGSPDPKPAVRKRQPTRVRDAKAIARKLLRDRACRACGRPVANGHHIVQAGQGGDDVEENIVGICGSGSAGCHGALHGNPYTDVAGRRWTSEDVLRAVGERLRPDEIQYVLWKLGPEAGESFLLRRYGMQDLHGALGRPQ